MRVFVISDTHFGHIKLEELGERPYKTLEKIIKNWNAIVNKDDLVIHLGDYVVGNSHWNSLIRSLNGRKILVLGNHDKKSPTWYIKNGFDFACFSFMWKYFGLNILFTHAPSEYDNYDLNIHGHLHDGRHRGEYTLTDKHLLFSLEKHGYRPVLLKTLIDMHNKKLNKSNRR